MTIAAGYVDPGTGMTWIGADRRRTFGDTIGPDAQKILDAHGWRIAVSGDGRMLTLMDLYLDELAAQCETVHEFARRVRDLLERDGWSRCSREYPLDHNQDILVAQSGSLHHISANYSVTRVPAGQLWAIGSGMEYALGAAHALRQHETSGYSLVRAAIEAACAYDIFCGGGPDVVVGL